MSNLKMREALQNLLDAFVAGANSGDWGNWDPEKEPEVIAAREAIAQRPDESRFRVEFTVKAGGKELATQYLVPTMSGGESVSALIDLDDGGIGMLIRAALAQQPAAVVELTEDPFQPAADYLLEAVLLDEVKGTTPATLLQHRLAIGYNRASRLVSAHEAKKNGGGV